MDVYSWMSAFLVFIVFLCVRGSEFTVHDSLSIFPRNGATRFVESLDGIWLFRLQRPDNDGFKQKWFERDLSQIDEAFERMPVPSSFNDITEHKDARDFAGWVWYQRTFTLPTFWNGTLDTMDAVLRFGSVNYLAKVWVNGQLVTEHVGGHLPFQTLINSVLKFGAENRVTVAVNNELTSSTLPPGIVRSRPDYQHPGQNLTEMIPNFDFFPYAGIHRSVLLYFAPKQRILDLKVSTDVALTRSSPSAKIEYSVRTNVDASSLRPGKFEVRVKLFDKHGNFVTEKSSASNTLSINNANLWFPFPGTGNHAPGYLYRLVVQLFDVEKSILIDEIQQSVGIRRVDLTLEGFHINGQHVYLRGFGRHEDEPIRGRGLSATTLIKDFNLMKWTGANSFRTSHYPYSEELMDEADAQGYLVIDEVPAVGLQHFNIPAQFEQHLSTVRDLIDRDKNRPSVIAWSIANEPRSNNETAKIYFQTVADTARAADSSMKRPITAAIAVEPSTDFASWSLDFIMVNRYYGWYSDAGYIQVIRGEMVAAVQSFLKRFSLPVMISEYGADTVSGLHADPSFVFSEEYQVELITENHAAFDLLRASKQLIGEHIWNFADFQTKQDITRVGGNRKGIFTRDRRPKTSASVIRCRYWTLAEDTHPSVEHYSRQGVTLCPKVVL